MWRPPINFISLHYAYILSCSILSLIIIYPYGDLRAIDAFFFGASGSTESGLNTVDVKALKTYQQLVIYFIPIISNMGFINIIVVIVRLHWFEKRFKHLDPRVFRTRVLRCSVGPEPKCSKDRDQRLDLEKLPTENNRLTKPTLLPDNASTQSNQPLETRNPSAPEEPNYLEQTRSHISFAPDPHRQQSVDEKALYIPPPTARERGEPFVEVEAVHDKEDAEDDDALKAQSQRLRRENTLRFSRTARSISRANSIERAASSIFVIGGRHSSDVSKRRPDAQDDTRLPQLSAHATVGRNSNFHNLSSDDRQLLGGIEYRALRLLLKITLVYFFGLHLFGAICLAGWIQTSPPKYRQYLQTQGRDRTWWGFYSGATMVNNLGFTLTPDSMTMFKDATFPMLIMTFLAYAGNTCYPILLRVVIWVMKLVKPQSLAIQESLQFLLDHPRRCYTLLFPSRPTWILFGILLTLNFVDVVLIVALDLDNSAVNDLPLGPRILASLFQAASSRHTGTSVYNLADVNPAVQFSLLVMMYIAVFPIAISIRASNTYEERSLGVYLPEPNMDERNSKTYVLSHLRNQLSFDLWYIFLGIFCICIAESDHIMDDNDTAFAVFPIFFEVVSAYGNVGLSLGHPSTLTSLSGKFSIFSKLVICAMMIRGRHRMLPYSLDRAIQLPSEQEFSDGDFHDGDKGVPPGSGFDKSKRGEETLTMKRHHTN